MKRLLTIIGFLTWWGLLYASNPDGRDAEEALAQIDNQIAQYHQKGDTEKESEARWQKIQTLKNFSMTEKQAEEALIQMEWFRNNQQWDNYYRSWQLRSNALSAMGKLQLALQETQHMLSDAKERNNKLGHAMAYKQIGVIYLNMKQTEPAVDALQHYAELMKDEESDISSLSNIYYRMAKAYDYDEAYDKELQVTNDWKRFLREKVGQRTDPEARECYNAWYLAKAQTYKMQARYYLARGDAANALLYTDSVRLVTNEKDDHTSEIRAQALMMLGRGSEAAEIYQRLYHEKDSVFGRDARQHLDELNTLFQIDELKTEQQRTKFRYTLIAASSIVLALLVLLIFGRRNTIRQKKVNEQLRIANERAIVSSKMKTEFIRNISHEIRTPLNIVSGFTQILTSPDMDLPAGSKRDIQERVTENTDRITKLVDRMLELSDVNNETLIDRNDQTNALNIVSQAIDYSGITLHTRPGNADAAVVFNTLDNEEVASSVALLTNSRYAVHALAQLLENAVKFTNEGSITLRMTSSGTKVCFSVEDTGIGIPADQTEHIFEEFVQLNEFADGAGIGLTVARSIAQRMGGNLWLDTDYTQGSRFVLELLK